MSVRVDLRLILPQSSKKNDTHQAEMKEHTDKYTHIEQ